MTACITEKTREFKKYNFAQRLAAIVAASLFLPYFLCVPFIVFACGYSIFRGELQKKIFSQPGARFLMLVPALSLLAAAFAGNILGVFGAFAVALIFWCGLYFRSVMTGRLYNFILELICVLSVASFVIAAVQMIIIRSGNTQLYKSLYFVINPEYFHGLMQAYSVYRSVSTFFNANYFAAVASFAALICLYKFISANRAKAFYAAVFAVNIASMLLAGSRTAILAFFAGVLVLLFCMKKYRTLILVLAVIFAVVVALSMFPNAVLRFDSLSSTVTKRFGIWEKAVTLLKNPFCAVFGEGMWTYYFHSSKQAGFITAYHSHDMFLEFLLCFGAVGTGLITAYVAKCIKRVRKAKKAGAKSSASAIAAAVFCLLLASGVTDVIATGVETGIMLMFLFSAVGVYEKTAGDKNV